VSALELLLNKLFKNKSDYFHFLLVQGHCYFKENMIEALRASLQITNFHIFAYIIFSSKKAIYQVVYYIHILEVEHHNSLFSMCFTNFSFLHNYVNTNFFFVFLPNFSFYHAWDSFLAASSSCSNNHFVLLDLGPLLMFACMVTHVTHAMLLGSRSIGTSALT
jgi:hypothetical protein